MGVGPDAWLAQPVERATLDPGVMSSNPTLGAELTLKKKKKVSSVLWDKLLNEWTITQATISLMLRKQLANFHISIKHLSGRDCMTKA